MKGRIAATVIAATLTTPALGKIESQGANGFVVAYEADLSLSPRDAYDRWLRIGEWWSADHTYSGDAKNMSIAAAPDGCWCEALPNGGFMAHMRVSYAQPGQAILFSGGLGPLAYIGVAGSMSVEFKEMDQGTHVILRYVVGGYDPDGFTKWPAAVDGVLGEGFERYKAFAAKP